MLSILNITEESGDRDEFGINNYNTDTPIVGGFVEYKTIVATDNTTNTSDKSSRSSNNDDRDYYSKRIKENIDDVHNKVTIHNDNNNINKDNYPTLHEAKCNTNTIATTTTLETISLDIHFKDAKENEKNKTNEDKRLDKPYVHSRTKIKRVTDLVHSVSHGHPRLLKTTDAFNKNNIEYLTTKVGDDQRQINNSAIIDLSQLNINLNIDTTKYDNQIELEMIKQRKKREKQAKIMEKR